MARVLVVDDEPRILSFLGCALDGVEVLRRTIAARPEQQVIVLSGRADIDTKVR
jgi:hypothetical protein